ncbi:MAG: hypothetical protein WBN99_07945 [Mycobacterium sp.]
MPADLLGHLIGPVPFSSVWLWVAAACVVLTVLWYAAVLFWTAPGRQRAELSVVGALRAIQDIETRYEEGELAASQAGAALGVELRRFLREVTGLKAEYVQVPDIATVSGGALAPAAPVLVDLEDAQFNSDSTVDISACGAAVRELVRQWT